MEVLKLFCSATYLMFALCIEPPAYYGSSLIMFAMFMADWLTRNGKDGYCSES